MEYPHDTEFVDNFMNMAPKAQSLKKTIRKIDFIKIKNVLTSKYMIKEMKDNSLNRRKYFQSYY